MVTSVSSTASTVSQAATSKSKLDSNYETFLSLLTAQVQNQDPLSPMDTTEWTNQLVQYSSVEQAIKSNEYLEKLALASGETLSSAASYVGRYIEADTNTAVLNGGQASWVYALGSEAKSATMTITNASGVVVYAGDVENKTAGSHTFAWDGKSSSGQSLPNGAYQMNIAATNAQNNAIATQVSFAGTVSAVQQTDDGFELIVNGSPISMNSVTRIALSAN